MGDGLIPHYNGTDFTVGGIRFAFSPVTPAPLYFRVSYYCKQTLGLPGGG